jgi:hypothetical protein
MRHRLFERFLLVSLIITLSFRMASGQDVILGILEESHGHYAGDPNYRNVRVVFEKKGDVWQAFPSDCENQNCLKTITSSYPNEVKWWIEFDGKIVGQEVSHNRRDFRWYSDVGQQEIIGTDPVPTIGARSREFGGYTDAEVYRPLIANSRQYFTDPDRWKPFAASPELTTVLQQAFRQNFPKLCRLSEADNNTLEPLPYRDEDVKLVKSYESKSGWVVARLHLEAIDCADVEAGFDIDDPWFVIESNKKTVTYLDSGIWLVDAGDYDHDGRSELVFSINRENEGGYEIYYDGFRKHATFKFSYH